MIAAGAGKIEKGERIPLDVKVGDRVLFGKYSGTEIKIDDEDYLILREEEILAKLSRRSQSRRQQEVTFPLSGGNARRDQPPTVQVKSAIFKFRNRIRRGGKTNGKANRDW